MTSLKCQKVFGDNIILFRPCNWMTLMKSNHSGKENYSLCRKVQSEFAHPSSTLQRFVGHFIWEKYPCNLSPSAGKLATEHGQTAWLQVLLLFRSEQILLSCWSKHRFWLEGTFPHMQSKNEFIVHAIIDIMMAYWWFENQIKAILFDQK